MIRSTADHGIFIWTWINETSYVALETNDILMASPTRTPFLHLKGELEKLFDLQSNEGTILRFLNLRLIQSPLGISMDQTQHIRSKVLHNYFARIPPESIPKTLYPFPLEASFEQLLFEAPPLVGHDLQLKEKAFRFSFSHLVGELMHITTISRPDLAYACMRFSGYMTTPNVPIFDALHHTMCYLYHHQHLPIMYPSKPTKQGGPMLQTFWDTGKAEYLSSEFGNDLATFSDADHARCLRTRRSTSVYFILFNGILISWSCKKQPTTALHSTGAELTALHRGTFKTILLRSFLQSIGFYLNTPTPADEDNKGSIHLIRTNRLTDTVRHHAVKLSWLHEVYSTNQVTTAYTKTTMMLALS
jgi:hypothetical protein